MSSSVLLRLLWSLLVLAAAWSLTTVTPTRPAAADPVPTMLVEGAR